MKPNRVAAARSQDGERPIPVQCQGAASKTLEQIMYNSREEKAQVHSQRSASKEQEVEYSPRSASTKPAAADHQHSTGTEPGQRQQKVREWV
jgi:hypothetical protein